MGLVVVDAGAMWAVRRLLHGFGYALIVCGVVSVMGGLSETLERVRGYFVAGLQSRGACSSHGRGLLDPGSLLRAATPLA